MTFNTTKWERQPRLLERKVNLFTKIILQLVTLKRWAELRLDENISMNANGRGEAE